jgi:AraC family transcriptional regulator
VTNALALTTYAGGSTGKAAHRVVCASQFSATVAYSADEMRARLRSVRQPACPLVHYIESSLHDLSYLDKTIYQSESLNRSPAGMFSSVTAGEVVRVRASSGLRIVETLHAPRCHLANHTHDDVSIDLVVSGGFDERIGSRHVARAPGSVVVRPAGTAHANRYGTLPTRTLVIQCSLTAAVLGHWPGPSLTAPRVFAAHTARAFAERLQLLALNPSPTDPQVLSWELAMALGALTDDARDHRPRSACLRGLVAARETIIESPESVDLALLAHDVGLKPSAFTHAFRRRFGCAPSALLRRSRLDRAFPLLRDGRVTISMVAARCGFADHAHFAREFRRFSGSSPSTYRRAMTR